MDESLNRKPGQSAALLIAILLTVLALVGHRFLPERRLTLDSTKEGATFFLMHSGEGAPPKVDWVNQPRLHFNCQIPKESTNAGCSFT